MFLRPFQTYEIIGVLLKDIHIKKITNISYDLIYTWIFWVCLPCGNFYGVVTITPEESVGQTSVSLWPGGVGAHGLGLQPLRGSPG